MSCFRADGPLVYPKYRNNKFLIKTFETIKANNCRIYNPDQCMYRFDINSPYHPIQSCNKNKSPSPYTIHQCHIDWFLDSKLITFKTKSKL